MSQRIILLLFLALFFVAPATAALDSRSSAYGWRDGIFSVPLQIRDNSGVVRRDWPVTTGVPLPVGVVQEVGQLRLTDAAGREIPAQFTVLSRYGARDNSLRWVLLDFQVDVPANGEVTLQLRNDRPAQAVSAPIRITETREAITVDSGGVVATISRRDGSLLQSVRVGGKQVLQAGAGDGPALRAGEMRQMERFRGPSWNTHGWEKSRSLEKIHIAESLYRGGPPREVTVEMAAPLRSVIVIRGRHLPSERGRGILQDGLYDYAVRLHFYRGQSYVKVEYAIENADRAQPQWSHLFREASLNHTLTLGTAAVVTGGGGVAREGPATASFPVSSREEGWLVQGAGSSEKKYGRQVVQEGGYQVGPGTEGKIASPKAAGKRGRFLDVSDGEKGVAVAMRYLWEQAPRAIGLSPKRLRAVVQADRPGHRADADRPAYDLDLGERSLHDILYYFHTGDAREARVADVAEAFEYPLFARAPPSWYSDVGNWYFEIARGPGKPARGADSDQHWVPPSIGVGRHGESRSYNSGGHHDSLSSGWLSFLRTGLLADLERNLAISRWSIAHNPGWAYRDNIIRFGNGAERYRAVDRALEAWNRLTAFGPKDFYLWRSDQTYTEKTPKGEVLRHKGGRSYLNGYKVLPDMEHYALFRLFEYYYLTGDMRALDAIHGFVNWDINFQHHHLFQGRMQPLAVTDLFKRDPDALRRGHYSRVYAWMLFTNLTGYHATGSPVYDEFARWQIRRALSLLRHRHGQLTSWNVSAASVASRIFGRKAAVQSSESQSWMEAMGAIALHEAYKTYDDERILDGLWGQADYFSHHVLDYPRLGMINNRTGMPNKPLGYGEGRGATVTPQRHDWMIQAWPVLYHYSGWPDVAGRYRNFERARKDTWTQDRFLQTVYWEQQNVAKRSSRPPDSITDLRVTRADRSGIALTWTSPRDDGPTGRAERYFVKYSSKPIVEFAPTDHPARDGDKARIVQKAEELVLSRSKGKRPKTNIRPGEAGTEAKDVARAHPDWHQVDAFWMAEHVAGEPAPAPAGKAETFTVRELRPHNWFGAPRQPGLEILPAGTYYVAICSWDEDRNLSRLSNVVKLKLP
ncbi:MAG: exo-rhamnogalacturonan lyase family protein [Thiobacillus sp.]